MTALAPAAFADYSYEYAGGRHISIGADVRIRLTHFDRDTIHPGMVPDGSGGWKEPLPNGPALEYIRVRERVWGSIELSSNIKLSARLVNRWHHFSSSIGDNNDGTRTWEFPDETVVDQLKLDVTNIADSDWSLTLGRQDVFFGNGMIFLEGTPYDQGRTIYFDGLRVRYQTEKDDLNLFAFYNDFKDKTVFINDQNRQLRRGDIFTTGVYWTHHFNKDFNTDMYYIYSNVRDNNSDSGARNHVKDSDAYINIVGGRVFGDPTDLIGYSVEYAREFGEGGENMDDYTGSLFDGRLMIHPPKDIKFSPEIMLEMTSLSGDDPTSDEMEGWDPLFAEYPIWREELLPIMLNGNWTNLNQYRAQVILHLTKKINLTTAYAFLTADYGEAAPGFGGGDTIGQLFSAFLDIKLNDHLSVSFEGASFIPSSYWVEGNDTHWLRFQTVYKF